MATREDQIPVLAPDATAAVPGAKSVRQKVGELVYNFIRPTEYPSALPGVLTRRLTEGRRYADAESESGSFEPSPYQPSEAEDPDAKYQRLAAGGWERALTRFPGRTEADRIQNAIQVVHQPQHGGRMPMQGDQQGLFTLANYTLGAGSDERGQYLSMYDRWDLNQPLEGVVGTPFDIYDRLYYDPETFQRIPEEPAPPARTGNELVMDLLQTSAQVQGAHRRFGINRKGQ